MIFALVRSRSSRLIPGLRGTPAVMITTSEPRVASYLLAPVTLTLAPATGVASSRSRALPWGMPSTTSTSTTSPSSRTTAQWAAVAPTLPAPTMVILWRPMAYCPGPRVPTRGTPVIRSASRVSARRSVLSMWWTLFLPQARARIWIS